MSLKDCPNLIDLSALNKNLNIQDLAISDCKALTDKEYEIIASLSNLRELTLEEVKCTHLLFLRNLQNLKNLSILCRPKILKDSYNIIEEITGLESLYLSNVYNIDLIWLEYLKNLTQLTLEDCSSFDNVLDLRSLPSLKFLNLSGSSENLTVHSTVEQLIIYLLKDFYLIL